MIRINGHSNFVVEIEKLDNDYVITKKSDEKDLERLKNQINKQKYFFNFLMKDFNVFTPKILKFQEKTFYMEYIPSRNICDIIEDNQIEKINLIKFDLINIIEKYISLSPIKRIDFSIISNKILLIKNNLINNILLKDKKIITYIFIKLENFLIYTNKVDIKIPLGICHGDLTFSNILFQGDKIFLIDFLDSFIESPLIDIVKLRQDTKFYWILNVLKKCPHDINKIKIYLSDFDDFFDNYFKKYDWYNKFYKLFEVINILRILQYSKDTKIINNLIEILEVLIK